MCWVWNVVWLAAWLKHERPRDKVEPLSGYKPLMLADRNPEQNNNSVKYPQSRLHGAMQPKSVGTVGTAAVITCEWSGDAAVNVWWSITHAEEALSRVAPAEQRSQQVRSTNR